MQSPDHSERTMNEPGQKGTAQSPQRRNLPVVTSNEQPDSRQLIEPSEQRPDNPDSRNPQRNAARQRNFLIGLGVGVAIGVILVAVSAIVFDVSIEVGLRVPFAASPRPPAQIPQPLQVAAALPEPPTQVAQQPPAPLSQPTHTAAPPVPPTQVTFQSLAPTSQPTSLWQFYVDDIKSSVPNAQVTADTLKEIARKIPSDIKFFAEAEVGLIPYQHTWRILDREGPSFLDAPEGGYAYISWGYGVITAGEFSVSFAAKQDRAHLILVIGNPDDGTFVDLNTQLRLTNYLAGFAGVNFAAPAEEQTFPDRSIVNKAWFAQQLWWASKHRSITVTIIDVSSEDVFTYDVDPRSFEWTAE